MRLRVRRNTRRGFRTWLLDVILAEILAIRVSLALSV
jgi:hypothetical protein